MMGGFAFKFTVQEADGIVVEKRACLTPRCVRFLMKYDPDVIPDLPIESITERSGSGSLGKALLIVQVARFCLNCVRRLEEHLPLSLLEVTTLAHGFVTLLCYFAWWSKPLNIASPTWISKGEEHTREALALVQVLDGQRLDDFDQLCTLMRMDSQDLSANVRADSRFILASKAAKRYKLSVMELIQIQGDFLSFDFSPSFKDLFVNFGIGTGAIDDVVTAGIPIIYGLWHFIGWRAHFPTTIERMLWRASTLVVMSSGVVASMFFIANRKCRGSSEGKNSFHVVLFRIIPSVYIVSSVYLLLESIRQLWYLPPEAYATVSL